MFQFDLHLYLKCHSSTNVFLEYFASKNQPPGLFISEALVENGLIKRFIQEKYLTVTNVLLCYGHFSLEEQIIFH